MLQVAYRCRFYNLLTVQVFVNEWVYQLTATSSLQQPRGILDWPQYGKQLANSSTANSTGCVQVRDAKLPNGCG